MAARVDASGRVFQLDRSAEPDEIVTEEDAKDAGKLARILVRVLRDLADIKRRFFPRRIDFEDRAVVSGDVLRLNHGFSARVRYWVVDWRPFTPGDVAVFDRNAGTNAQALLLNVGNSGTVTVRVESAG
jgi:hypothetical protein